MTPIVLSTTTYFLIVLSLVALLMFLINHTKSLKKKSLALEVIGEHGEAKQPPGPKPWPIIGSLHILGQYDIPYKAFDDLAKAYNSQIIKIQLGSVPSIIINGLENIKEILFVKAHDFDSRPNFTRYHLLFSGDKENSLAFCNWSQVQKVRREMLRIHTFPRAFTHKYNQLNVIIGSEVENLLVHLDKPLDRIKVAVKPLVLKTCANIFTSYFCSTSFQFDDPSFSQMVFNFDKIFYEVNQGYAADFIPFLMPLHKNNMIKMSKWSHEIRQFMIHHVVGQRFDDWQTVINEEDYVDCLINHIKTQNEPKMNWETGLFSLEDIIGGHSAIGNFFVKLLGYIVTRKNVQEKAQREIDSLNLSSNYVGLEYRKLLPYTEAIFLESIRVISSPIVPHVASKDSSVAGYKIEKDTLIFLNNYGLNMSDKLWNNPEQFIPDRFIKDGKILKPEHFIPFGGGKRSCMGYKMVQYLTFSILATLLKNYNILPVDNECYKVPIGSLAVPQVSFNFRFEKR